MVTMPTQKLIVLMGSRRDLPFARRIGVFLEKEEIPVEYEYNISSAHKTPETLIEKMTVAGYSKFPVIACPPDSKKYGWTKVFSSVMTPQGVAVLFTSEPENAALAAVKILALSNHSLYEKITTYQQKRKEEVIKADKEIKERRLRRET